MAADGSGLPHLTVLQGALVTEVRQVWNAWVAQVIRLICCESDYFTLGMCVCVYVCVRVCVLGVLHGTECYALSIDLRLLCSRTLLIPGVCALETTIGPIDISDGNGKEVFSRFTSQLKTTSTWYTDSEGSYSRYDELSFLIFYEP